MLNFLSSMMFDNEKKRQIDEQSKQAKEKVEIIAARAKKIDALLVNLILEPRMMEKEEDERRRRVRANCVQQLAKGNMSLHEIERNINEIVQSIEMVVNKGLMEEGSESDSDSQNATDSDSQSDSESERRLDKSEGLMNDNKRLMLNEQLAQENERLMDDNNLLKQENERLINENRKMEEVAAEAKRAIVGAVRDAAELRKRSMMVNELYEALIKENQQMSIHLNQWLHVKDKIIMDQRCQISSLQKIINLARQAEAEAVKWAAKEEAEKRAATETLVKEEKEAIQDKLIEIETLVRRVCELEQDNLLKAEAAKWAEAVAMKEMALRAEAEAKTEALEKEVNQLRQRVVEAEETAKKETEFSAAIMNMEYEIVEGSDSQ